MQIKISEKLKAMTLAEVLITLVVLGVVFALTVPVIKDSSDRVKIETLLKKSYSLINQAIDTSLVKDKEDSVADWTFGDDGKMFKRLSGHMNYTKKCDANSGECFGASYRLMNGSAADSFAATEGVFFSDEIAIGVTGCGSDSCDIVVDVNGPKSPNVVGYDLFMFTLKKDESGVTYKDSGDDYGKTKDIMENGWVINYW